MSTKIHAAVDALGNLARFRLAGGERHDITEAENLIDGLQNVGAVVASPLSLTVGATMLKQARHGSETVIQSRDSMVIE